MKRALNPRATVEWDAGRLAAALRPVRSCREVGGMLGLSESAVRRVERGALRKIIRAVARMELPKNHPA